MIRIERNRAVLKVLLASALVLLAAAAFLHFLDPDSTWRVIGFELNADTLAIALSILGFLTLASLPCIGLQKGAVELHREGILLPDLMLWRWGDIQSVSCYRQHHLPACNVTFNDGRQCQIQSYLLGENFDAIGEVFRDVAAREKLAACPNIRDVKVRHVSPTTDGPVKPLISLDAPTHLPFFGPFAATAGVAVLLCVAAYMDYTEGQAQMTTGLGIGGVVAAALSIFFFRKWRAAKERGN